MGTYEIQTEFTARIRISPIDLEWIQKNKNGKSAAAFLHDILDQYKQPDLFKKQKK